MQVWPELGRANKVGRLHQSLKQRSVRVESPLWAQGQPGAGRSKDDKQHLGPKGAQARKRYRRKCEHTLSPTQGLLSLIPAMLQPHPTPPPLPLQTQAIGQSVLCAHLPSMQEAAQFSLLTNTPKSRSK